ncbi:NAD(P)/FAD-dependent oxidoreductase [Blautia sp. Sow4_E7]|uniref:NAD(P)/FAD-dependent oxidoreductase n=1 Tax=Blautia sp. Sow4_E7 TaxID=3438749 RepID=UPI003F8EC11D
MIIVGGGASGLMAAIAAAQNGAAVTILEQNEKPGKKICATGNGKCNFTNIQAQADAYRSEDPDFWQEALKQFSVEDTIAFFTRLGIYPVNKNNGYLYPHSGQAASVAEVLCMEARNLGVKIKTNQKVQRVFREPDIWKIQVEGWTYEGDAVILANGSKASAISGSDGSGYELAAALGHKIIEPLPALTALKCKNTGFSGWAGVRTEGRATLLVDGKKAAEETGELQLTDYGVSGIPVFQISRYGIRALKQGKNVTLNLNFLPEFSREQLNTFLKMRKENCPYKGKKEFLTGLFPDKLAKVLLAAKDLEEAIFCYPLKVTGYQSFEQAQVCSGGVDTRSVDKRTLESRQNPGLYFAGELLDVDGKCGGYNLQWAWSSGYVAGTNAARQQKNV